MFTYEPTGKIRISGCAGNKYTARYIALFLAGDRAYVKQKAKIGKTESVVIKRLNRVYPEKPIYSGIRYEVMYTDTFNRVWEEEELLSEENAVDLAKLHWENISQEGRILFEENGCYPIKPEGCG